LSLDNGDTSKGRLSLDNGDTSKGRLSLDNGDTSKGRLSLDNGDTSKGRLSLDTSDASPLQVQSGRLREPVPPLTKRVAGLENRGTGTHLRFSDKGTEEP
jgi:hypothetical protein